MPHTCEPTSTTCSGSIVPVAPTVVTRSPRVTIAVRNVATPAAFGSSAETLIRGNPTVAATTAAAKETHHQFLLARIAASPVNTVSIVAVQALAHAKESSRTIRLGLCPAPAEK